MCLFWSNVKMLSLLRPPCPPPPPCLLLPSPPPPPLLLFLVSITSQLSHYHDSAQRIYHIRIRWSAQSHNRAG